MYHSFDTSGDSALNDQAGDIGYIDHNLYYNQPEAGGSHNVTSNPNFADTWFDSIDDFKLTNSYRVHSFFIL